MTYATATRLEDIFRQVLNLSPGGDVTHLDQADEPAWDSLAHVSLILAIESEFGVEIDVADSIELTSFDSVSRFLEGHGA